MQGFSALLPACFEHAAPIDKICGLYLYEPQSFSPAAKQHVGVRRPGQQHEEGMQQSMLCIGTSGQRAAQRGQRAFENRRESQQRFAARAGDAVACRHQLAVAGGCRACNRDRAQIATPIYQHNRAQVVVGQLDVARSCATGGGGEQAERENRAAVRVDAARGLQHARLGGDTELLQFG
jgi:hypothetical protein